MSEKRRWEQEEEAEQEEWIRQGGVKEGDDRLLVESVLVSEEIRRHLGQTAVTYSIVTVFQHIHEEKPKFRDISVVLLGLFFVVLSIRFWRKSSQEVDTWQSDAFGHGIGLVLALGRYLVG